jgi:hypothetical protein
LSFKLLQFAEQLGAHTWPQSILNEAPASSLTFEKAYSFHVLAVPLQDGTDGWLAYAAEAGKIRNRKILKG